MPGHEEQLRLFITQHVVEIGGIHTDQHIVRLAVLKAMKFGRRNGDNRGLTQLGRRQMRQKAIHQAKRSFKPRRFVFNIFFPVLLVRLIVAKINACPYREVRPGIHRLQLVDGCLFFSFL